MRQITVINRASGRSYCFTGPIYETPTVWCGTGKDPQLGDLFVKILRYDRSTPEGQERQRIARQEAQVMLRVSQCTDRVPKLYDHWDDRSAGSYVLVMQKMPGTDLRRWLKNRPAHKINDQTVWLHSLLLRQTAQILQDIHKKIPGISHRDLKPENIMVWKDEQKHWQVGLVDFGTAALHYSVQVGTEGYQAPEQITLQDTIMGTGEAKDVFSLGIIWYELLTLTPVDDLLYEFYPDYDNRRWESRPVFPPELLATRNGKRYAALFEKMTDYDPSRRPTLRDVVNKLAAR